MTSHEAFVPGLDALWEKYEEQRVANKADVTGWSRERLGEGESLFRWAAVHAETTLKSLDRAAGDASDPSLAAQFRAVQLQLEFALGRLLNARDLLVSGFLFDGGGLLRVAWESTTRAAVFVTHQDKALAYMGGTDFGPADIRKALDGPLSSRLQSTWATLSQFSHSYSLHALHLQMEPGASRTELRVTQNGVHRERDLLVMYTECIHLVDSISRLLIGFSDHLGWEPAFLISLQGLREQVDLFTNECLKRVEAIENETSS